MNTKPKYKTRQRGILLEYLKTIPGEHFTAGDICEYFKSQGSPIGQSTVYRQLEELVDEGLSREFISKVQQMRKAANFEMMDRIRITYKADEDVAKAVAVHKDHIMGETLAVEMAEGEGGEVFKLNGHETAIKVERV